MHLLPDMLWKGAAPADALTLTLVPYTYKDGTFTPSQKSSPVRINVRTEDPGEESVSNKDDPKKDEPAITPDPTIPDPDDFDSPKPNSSTDAQTKGKIKVKPRAVPATGDAAVGMNLLVLALSGMGMILAAHKSKKIGM